MKPRLLRRALAPTAALALVTLGLAACGDGDGGGGAASGVPEVKAAVYPLEYLAEEVGGENVEVSPLTPPGMDPHDLELSTSDVMALEGSVVVYLSGFQAAVDDAIAVAEPERALDVAEPARVTAFGPEGEPDGSGPVDPHFWLDPERMADVAGAVAEEFAEADPEHAEDYAANAEALRGEFEDLDAAYAEGLADCEIRTVVAAHEAYGYLGHRYGLEQVGILGIDPDSEPSPAAYAGVRRVVESTGVEVIFAEQLIDPTVAQALADELGIEVGLLDPAENRPEDGDYLDVMYDNLNALTEALRCS